MCVCVCVCACVCVFVCVCEYASMCACINLHLYTTCPPACNCGGTHAVSPTPPTPGISYGSKEYWHLVIEALRLSFADGKWYISDPAKVSCPVEQLLSRDYADGRRQLIQPNK